MVLRLLLYAITMAVVQRTFAAESFGIGSEDDQNSATLKEKWASQAKEYEKTKKEYEKTKKEYEAARQKANAEYNSWQTPSHITVVVIPVDSDNSDDESPTPSTREGKKRKRKSKGGSRVGVDNDGGRYEY